MGGTVRPILAMSPSRWLPRRGGNTAVSARMTAGALAMGSAGNRTLPSVSARRPCRTACSSTVRCTPTSPPTPSSEKPSTSGMGGKSSAVIRTSIE